MGGFAWVTLATNDSYSLGALVLAHSLRHVGTAHELAVLVTPGVTSAMRQKLATGFNVVQEVDILNSKDEANLRLLKRPELGITFTKLHCWRLVQFEKCVFLDADTLVLENCDELFERDEFSAAPDVGWPDCFNSGVFVFKPSNETYESLIKFALERGSFDGGDQGLLNLYFSNWAHTDISKHLPFIYNMCSTACYSYLPAFKQFGENVKVVHFIGPAKPWLQYFDTESRQVHPTPGLQHLQVVLQRWWNIFCSSIHSNLSSEMARGRPSDVHSHHEKPFPPNYNPSLNYNSEHFGNFENNPSVDYRNAWDPWDSYEEANQLKPDANADAVAINDNNEPQSSYEQSSNVVADTIKNEDIKPFESHDKNAQTVDSRVIFHAPEPAPEPFQPIPEPQHHNPPHVVPAQQHQNVNNSTQNTESPNNPVQTVQHSQNTFNPAPPAPQNKFESASIVAGESILHDKDRDEARESDAGLAGALAQVTLGAPRTPGQSALEDHLRRQGWEVGNIDYLGVDSFDNIWKKICETLSSASPAPAQQAEIPKPREPSPPTAPTEPAVCPAKTVTQTPQPDTQKEVVAVPTAQTPETVQEAPKATCEEVKSPSAPETDPKAPEQPPKLVATETQAVKSDAQPAAPQPTESTTQLPECLSQPTCPLPQLPGTPAALNSEQPAVPPSAEQQPLAALLPQAEAPKEAGKAPETVPLLPSTVAAAEISKPPVQEVQPPAPMDAVQPPQSPVISPETQADVAKEATVPAHEATLPPTCPTVDAAAPATADQTIAASPDAVNSAPVCPAAVAPAPPSPAVAVPTPASPADAVTTPASPPADATALPAVQVAVKTTPATPTAEAPAPLSPAAEVPTPASPADEVPTPACPASEVPTPASPATELPTPVSSAMEAQILASPAVQAPTPTSPATESPTPTSPAVAAQILTSPAVQAPTPTGPPVEATTTASAAAQVPTPTSPTVETLTSSSPVAEVQTPAIPTAAQTPAPATAFVPVLTPLQTPAAPEAAKPEAQPAAEPQKCESKQENRPAETPKETEKPADAPKQSEAAVPAPEQAAATPTSEKPEKTEQVDVISGAEQKSSQDTAKQPQEAKKEASKQKPVAKDAKKPAQGESPAAESSPPSESATGPTPPPRKGSGNAKKPKGKK